MPPTSPVRVALVGASGYGERHLDVLEPLHRAGDVDLVALVDPAPLGERARATGAVHHRDLDGLLGGGPVPDVVVIATPIPTHAALATAALRAGAHVLLEKPPTASLASFEQLCATRRESGRHLQVGFQSLGSHALPAIAELLASGRIGELRAVSATGLWLRRRAYYARSPWAGKRRIGEQDVVDGVVTNPLAHAVTTALAVAGARTSQDVASVRTELYRANDIAADDTSVVQVVTTAGIPVTCALTLCAPQEQDPWVRVEGTLGRATFHYKTDELVVETEQGREEHRLGRDGLLLDLLAVLRGEREQLLVPLESTGAFMRVLEEVRTAADPTPIDPSFVQWHGDGDDAHPVVADIAAVLERVTTAGVGLAALGVPWATRPEPEPLTGEQLRLAGHEVAAVRLPAGVAPTSSPRPCLHPVRTLTGTLVSAHQPLDHVWHQGVGVALQDVDGVNLWGGRTFTRAQGRYVWRADHGSVHRVRADRTGAQDDRSGALTESLVWRGPAGQPLLHEDRTWSYALTPDGTAPAASWVLDLDVSLRAPGQDTVHLGSPGSNGRPGGGYGGIFWRLPEVAGLQVWSGQREGEQAVHGTRTPWVCLTGDFPTGPDAAVEHAAGRTTAAASLLLLADDDDPWFVRVAGYPGVGRSLAWDSPVALAPGGVLRRKLRAVVVDGPLDRRTAQELASRHALTPGPDRVAAR